MNRLFSSLRFFSNGCALPQPQYGAVSIQRTKKRNGIKIAGANLFGAQYGACTVMFKAGSRYESDDTLGATHFLRAVSDSKGKNFTSFIKIKCLQHHGGYLTCSSDRQTISYTLRCPPPLFKEMKKYLLDATSNGNFQWEIDDRRHIVLEDLTRLGPVELVMDLIQKASFSGPLANSMYCEEDHVNAISDKSLKKFKDEFFGPSECSVASVGLPFEETINLADGIETRTARMRVPEVCSKPRNGYEYSCLGPIGTTWMALAVPGCGSHSFRCLIAHSALAAACGSGSVQAGQHELDRMMERPLSTLSGDLTISFRAFNVSYIDTGIFGILIEAPATKAREAACQAVQFLACKLNRLTHEEVKAGIQRLRLNLRIHQQDCANLSEGLALELASSECISEDFDLLSFVDTITPDEVLAVAQRIALKAPYLSFAAVGDLSYAPNDAELRC